MAREEVTVLNKVQVSAAASCCASTMTPIAFLSRSLLRWSASATMLL